MASALGHSAHLTLEAFACAATQRVAVAVVNGMIDLLDGGCAGCHAAFAQLHQFCDGLHLRGGENERNISLTILRI